MADQIFLTNPKRKNTKQVNIYDYYAGYSPDFVKDTIKLLDVKETSLILDPWNGSGTTTQIAEQMGHHAIGYDINPVMLVVAKSRLLNKNVNKSIFSIGEDIVSKAKRYRTFIDMLEDPLNTWLYKEGTRVFRKIEAAIQHLLIGNKKHQLLVHSNKYDDLSSLCAFYYVALFKTIRDILRCFQSSNPTWVKTPKNENEKLIVKEAIVYETYLKHVSEMLNALNQDTEIVGNPRDVYIDLKISSSLDLPLKNEFVDVVITSPPYCTRIDYAVATKLELAILGFGITKEFKDLRRQMIGTTTINKERIIVTQDWGNEAIQLVEKIRSHHTKASNSYYLKNYLQYFNSMNVSLKEIDRVLKNNSYCALVVQDSFYKDVHVNLPLILTEMCHRLRWDVHQEFEFGIKRTMAGINKQVTKYRSGSSAIEKVLIFKKVGG